MSATSIGAIVDNLVYLGLGIGLIYMSIAQKEKIGRKVVIVRLGGIASIGIGLFGIISLLIKH